MCFGQTRYGRYDLAKNRGKPLNGAITIAPLAVFPALLKMAASWQIPKDTQKPKDRRQKNAKGSKE